MAATLEARLSAWNLNRAKGTKQSAPVHLGAVLVIVLALWGSHPLAWTERGGLWAPSAGLTLTLVAWLGGSGAVPYLLAGAGLVFAQVSVRLLAEGAEGPVFGLVRLLGVALDLGLGVAQALVAWRLYHRVGRGVRSLSDPRSATLFLFLVLGAALVPFALVRAVCHTLLGDSLARPSLPAAASWVENFASLLLRLWLEQGLGVLVVAPPLLVTFTPWLLRHRLILPELGAAVRRQGDRGPVSSETLPFAVRMRGSDWIELGGLLLGSSLLCLLFTQLQNRRELLGWQLWGVQVLLIVWASIRQGMRGGTLVAAVAAAVPLLVLTTQTASFPDPLFLLLLQSHLLAQCAAALLVASAASWVRISETGYRRVVSHIPVIIYSAQFQRDVSELGARNHATAGGSGPGEGSYFGLAEVTLVSAGSFQTLGLPPEQLLGDYSRWIACIHPDDRELLLAALTQLGRQEQPVTCEYRVVVGESGSSPRPGSQAGSQPPSNSNYSAASSTGLASGTPRFRWLRDTLAPTRDAEGQLVGWEGVVIDITEQRILADDLRQTTSMFHALVANLPAGVFFVRGPQGQPILVNARARQLLGQREDPAAGLEQLSRVYRLHRADGTPYPVEELPVYLALRAGRMVMRDDIVVHRPDGRRIPLVTWAAPVSLGGKGAPDAAVWVLEDLTALHQAEAARQDSESRLRAVVETMAEGLLVQDHQGVILDCNPCACTLLGAPAEQLRDRPLGEVVGTFLREDGSPLPADDYPYQTVLRRGRPVRNLVVGIQSASWFGQGVASPDRSRGSIRWVLVNALPLGLGRGAVGREPEEDPFFQVPTGVVTTFSDLTAYVQAREAIQASEEKYRGLIETLPVMLLQWDRRLHITYINPAFREVTGYALEDVAEPESWSRMVFPDDLPRLYDLAHRGLAGHPGRAEFRYHDKEGRDRSAFAITQPQWADGEVIGTITALLDLTRERQLERDLQRTQRLGLIGQLSSGVAHDFNNLLGVVLSLADLARNSLPPEHPVHEDLQRIIEAGEQAVGLAGQLLAFCRNRNVTPRRVNLHAVVKRTLELLRLSHLAQFRVEAELVEGELCVQADETQVQQVLINLCLNARDAMTAGGLLRIQTCCTSVEGRPFAVLTVLDTGKGMPEEVRARVFEAFFSTKETGTGLGLAMVQQIVTGAGGRIEVASEVGQGSRFDVWWPAS